jgi:hypothetical protein
MLAFRKQQATNTRLHICMVFHTNYHISFMRIPHVLQHVLQSQDTFVLAGWVVSICPPPSQMPILQELSITNHEIIPKLP